MFFQYHFQSVLLLFGFLQGIIFTGLTAWRGVRGDRESDKLLALLLFICSLHTAEYMLGFGGWYDSRDEYTTFMFYFPFHQMLLIGPIIYFYFRSLTNTRFQLSRKEFWHFIPGLLYLFVRLIFFLWDIVYLHWIKDIDLPLFYNTKGILGAFNQDVFSEVISMLELISMIIYLVLTIRAYQNYRNYIYDHYSDTESIEFKWMRNLLYALIIGLLGSLLFDIIDVLIVSLDYNQFWHKYMTVSIMIYLVSILGYTAIYKLPRDLAFEPKGEEKHKATRPSTVSDLEQWKEKLVHLMTQEKAFLNPDLTLSELAQRLSTNASVLSKVINSGFGQNFNDFINAHRVKAVQERLDNKDAKHLTLIGIAFESGFNSKATFNRAFKKFTQLSPREYMKQNL